MRVLKAQLSETFKEHKMAVSGEHGGISFRVRPSLSLRHITQIAKKNGFNVQSKDETGEVQIHQSDIGAHVFIKPAKTGNTTAGHIEYITKKQAADFLERLNKTISAKSVQPGNAPKEETMPVQERAKIVLLFAKLLENKK